MTVDRGGLAYTIAVEDKFSPGLSNFRDRVVSARREWAALKKDVQGFAPAARAAAKATDSITQAQERAERSFRKASAQADRGTKVLSLRERAERKYAQAVERAALAREFARVAEERSFGIMRRTLTTQQAQAKAAITVTRALDKQILAVATLNEAQSRGLKLNDKQLFQLGAITPAQFRLARAKERLATATNVAADAQLRELRIQEQVVSRRSRAEDKAKIASLLAAQGLDINGRPIVAKIPKVDRILTGPEAQAKAANIVTKAINKQILAVATLYEAQSRGLKLNDKQLFQLGAITPAQFRLAKAKERLATATNVAADAQLRELRIQEQVVSRKSRAEDQAKIASLLAAQGLDRNGRPIVAKIPKRTPILPESTVVETEGRLNRISFTFRRLFGILAAFAAARFGLRIFQDFVKGGVQFNRVIEQTELGIGAVIAASAKITTATGENVSAAEAFGLAQNVARRQLGLLRIDALSTTASLESLSEAFQSAIAPGLGAGLNLDQIRTFSVRISQAATSIGLSQSQLAEEIRSILQGTVQIRQTRIAAALGIDNEDIRRAKELGTFYEFLEQKFQAFAIAGDKLVNTFDGALTRAKTAISVVAGAGSIGFFEELKGLLADIFNSLVEVNKETGKIVISPKAVAAVRRLYDGLQGAVQSVRQFADTINLDDIGGTFELIGNALKVITDVLIGIISGAATGLKTVGTVLQAITTAVDFLSFGLFDNKGLQETVALLTNLLVIWGAVKVVVLASTVLIGGIKAALVAASAAAALLQFAMTRTNTVMVATSLAAKSLRATLASTGIGLVAVLLGTLATFGAQKLGAFDWLDKTLNPGLETATDRASDLRKEISDLFLTSRSQIRGALDPLESVRDTLKDIGEESRKIQRERSFFGISPATVQASGAIAEAFKIAFSSQEESFNTLLNSTREIAKERAVIQAAVVDDAKAIADLGAKESISAGRLTKALEALVDYNTTILKTKEEIARLDFAAEKSERLLIDPFADLLAQRKEFNAQRKKLEDEQNIFTRKSLVPDALPRVPSSRPFVGPPDLSVENLRKATALLDKTLGDIKATVDALKLSEDGEKSLLAISRSSAEVGELRLAAAAKLNDLLKARALVEDEITAKQSEQLRSLLEISRIEREQQALLRSAQARATTIQALADGGRDADVRLAESRAEIILLDAAQVIERQRVDAQLESLRILIQTNEALRDSLEIREKQIRAETNGDAQSEGVLGLPAVLTARANTEASIAELKAEQTRQSSLQLEIERQLNAERDAALRKQEDNRLRASNSDSDAPAQIELAAQTLFDELPSRFDIILDTMRSAVQGFSQFLTQTIVDAFDPTATGSAKERFGRFLQGLASQIISTLITIAITAIVLNAASSGILGAVLGPVGSAALGGQVPQSFAKGGRIHRAGRRSRRMGYDSGGQIEGFGGAPAMARPLGISPKDTVPIWTQPDEWVIRRDAARKYGSDVMDALNRGLIDPLQLRALAGVKGASKRSARKTGRGYAAGGAVGSASVAAPREGFGAPQPALVVANDGAMEMLLAGGSTAMERFLAERGYRPQ